MKKLLTMLYPRRCPFCDAVIPEELSACPGCLAGLKTANCNISIKYTNSIVSLYLYEPPVSNAIVRMKFENCPDLADSLGRMMAAKLAKTFPGLPFDGVLPVPMTTWDCRMRGYSQTFLMAKAICRETGLPLMKNILIKNKQTPKQHDLSRELRLTNLAGAYKVRHPEKLLGKRVLLCDDVVTTGATLAECAGTLKKNGAVFVAAITFSQA